MQALMDPGTRAKPVKETTVEPDEEADDPLDLRRSTRPRKLTEKTRQSKEQDLTKTFWKAHNHCLSITDTVARDLTSAHSPSDLEDLVSKLEREHQSLNGAYGELRNVCASSPPSEIRRGTDKLSAKIDKLVGRAQALAARPSSRKSRSHISVGGSASRHSNTASVKRELEAKAAALQVALLREEREDELQRLAIAEETRRALREAELAADQLRRDAEEKARRSEVEAEMARRRRELLRKEMAEELRREQAMALRDAEEESLFETCSHSPSARHAVMLPPRISPAEVLPALPARNVTQISPAPAWHTEPLIHHNLRPQASPWYPPAENSKPSRPLVNPEDTKTEATPQPTAPRNDIEVLIKTLAASVNLGRLPVPEPTVFHGDALMFPDWSASFTALIDNRGVPPQERIHFLKKYLGGPAREAVSGCFLLRSQNAYEEAKSTLEKRYGHPFAMIEAFREKLDSRPKIGSRDSKALRQYSDFLKQCKIAMMDIKGLEILNDPRENRKMLLKLPEWMIPRWGRIASKENATSGNFPPFKDFANFVAMEAEIACDPITSLGSLKSPSDRDKAQIQTSPTKRHAGTRTLATDAREKYPPSSKSPCLFCKGENHGVQDCRTLGLKPMAERQEFVKKGGLCFGCLQHGHMSKRCPRRSTCKRCNHNHPTCLHSEEKISSSAGTQSTTVILPEA
ncbi:uncharacterized protein LOC135490881 [Lineus longissimus]|uniref:uncharacterized protein LOC135490881 n=1 Tax=Lineus longissimus TaxID=88925 RepID=UPI002B4DFE69